MILRELCQLLETFAPLGLAADWDNTGLLAGDPAGDVNTVLLAVDLTEAVLAEAIALRADLVLCYHPPIFHPLRRVVAVVSTQIPQIPPISSDNNLRNRCNLRGIPDAGTGSEGNEGSRVFLAIRNGIALYAMHTALDAAAGGTNDALADLLGLVDTRPLAPAQTIGQPADPESDPIASRRFKLVTFVPADAVDRVADAIFAAGGGQIGPYSRCSFRVAGAGTFLGVPGSAPAVGTAGRFERVDEVRLEVEIPSPRAASVVAALRRAHPYQTVAFDLYPLADLDERVGQGRVGRLAEPVTVDQLVQRIKRGLGVDAVWLADPHVIPPPLGGLTGVGERGLPARGSEPPAASREPAGPPARSSPARSSLIHTAACCAGSCGELYRRALSAGAGLYLTGEFRHHDALESARAGMAVVAVRHSVSERVVLPRLAGRLAGSAPELTVRISQADADPFRWA